MSHNRPTVETQTMMTIIITMISDCIAPDGCNFRGASSRSDQCSVKDRVNRTVLSLNLNTESH